MGSYVLGFQEIDQTQVAIVGGKGAHLGELSRIEGIRVPAGFCVTTDAFRRIMAEAPSIDERLDRLSRLKPNDREAIRTLSAEIRRTLEGIAIPDDLAATITLALGRLGQQAAYAVRSSATAEDMPTASFAGQQDTYLNVVGPAAILEHISRCWASLFTERAVTYRLRNGFGHRKVHMAVVVQQMVFPEAAGVLFTADPVTSNRKVACVEASFGLGEAVVSGLVNADAYQVRDGEVVAKTVATKQLAIHALPAGGTQEQAIDPTRQEQPALTDAQAARLAQLGRRIEAHFGRPQDIEWCLVDDEFQIVQSRPITTLFPIPAAGDRDNHVYVSVGHQQMMTDPMKPLGLSLFQLTALPPMYEAGGRLFVEVTQGLASPARRAGLLEALGKSDPLIGDALQKILERDGFIPSLPDEGPGGAPPGDVPAPIETNPAIVTELIGRSQASIAALKRRIRTKSGSCAARLHPGGHPGVESDPVRSEKPSGVHVGDGGHVVAKRASADVARREERGRHAHAVRPPQRHVGDGSSAPGRRGRDPPASGGGGFSATRRGRGIPGRSGQACGRAGSAGRHPGLPRQVRHAGRR
jgi:pyruvate,water dikinase